MEKNNYCEMFINGHSVKYDHSKSMSNEIWNLDPKNASKILNEYIYKYSNVAIITVKLVENHPALLLYMACQGYNELKHRVNKKNRCDCPDCREAAENE